MNRLKSVMKGLSEMRGIRSGIFTGALILGLIAPSWATPVITDPGPNSGQTVTINQIGDMFDAKYFEDTQTNDGDGIIGTLESLIWYELTGFATDQSNEVATFAIMIMNNSTGGQNGRVTSFGFDVLIPDAILASAGTGYFAALDEDFGAGFMTVDICVFVGSTCVGGGGGGITPGNTDTTTLSLTYPGGTMLSNGLSFGTPFVRYQSVTAQDGDFSECTINDRDCLSAKLGGVIELEDPNGPGPNPIPEPSTMLLLGSGLVGLIGYRMRKAQA